MRAAFQPKAWSPGRGARSLGYRRDAPPTYRAQEPRVASLSEPTIHAGEGFGASSIRQAIEDGGAGRIGHGTRLLEDESLLAQVRDAGIPLEICITSNVQTGVAATHAEHPVRHYYDEGLSVCLCTDNRLMSGVTLTEEYEHARDDLGFTWLELLRIARMAFEASYAAPEVKQKRLDDFDRDVVGL